MNERGTLGTLRRILIATLAVGIAGTATELLLLEHYEGWQQLLPVVLLGLALPACAWIAVRPSAASVRMLQILMAVFLLSGALGVVFHYQGNVEFELEMYPTMAGAELFRATMTGATPVLAPGTLVLLGMVGFACTYRHPRLQSRAIDLEV